MDELHAKTGDARREGQGRRGLGCGSEHHGVQLRGWFWNKHPGLRHGVPWSGVPSYCLEQGSLGTCLSCSLGIMGSGGGEDRRGLSHSFTQDKMESLHWGSHINLAGHPVQRVGGPTPP